MKNTTVLFILNKCRSLVNMIINTLKQKIQQLDAGSFQNLCDEWLFAKGYNNINSLGTHAGTQKTTKGTPDTYFLSSDNKYIFAEYTVQQSNLVSKIKKDIDKCLDADKTGIPIENISEIIYCHTSSNIKPKDDFRLKNKCKEKGIILTIYGIDAIANDLYNQYRYIAKDFLGVSIDTDQIKDLNNFIKTYNSNKLAAPIDNKFMFRDNELKELNCAIECNDVIIISGSAGVGKTKLCLHFSNEYTKNHNCKLLCIKDNDLSIYEDLKFYLNNPGNYLLFVDDANQLSGFNHMLQYVTQKKNGYNVKIIASVRDYAVDKLKQEINSVTAFAEIKVGLFSTEEIESLIKSVYNIDNQIYVERIVNISDGNARLAMLAGRIAIENTSFDSIKDATQIYDTYYSKAISDSGLKDDNKLLITSGVIALVKSIHLDHLESITPILDNKNISDNEFTECIYKLHTLEFVDICNDKAVRISDQCLSNYLLKYIFYDKKLIDLEYVIDVGFSNFRDKLVYSINTLLNIFFNDDLIYFVGNKIKSIWNKMKNGDPKHYFEFVKIFHNINPTETLLMIKREIDNISAIDIDITKIDTKSDRNYITVNDDILNLLGDLSDKNLDISLDLFFEYYLKRPDKYIQFYHTINIYYGIEKYSHYKKYNIQVKFFEKLKKYSDNWNNEFIKLIFLDIISDFLKFEFSQTEYSSKKRMQIYNFQLVDSANLYRNVIWESLLELVPAKISNNDMCNILKLYGNNCSVINLNIVENDIVYINKILDKMGQNDSAVKNIIARNIYDKASQKGVKSDKNICDKYFNSDKLKIYDLIERKTDFGKSVSERRSLKEQKLKQYIKEYNQKDIEAIIDICSELEEFNLSLWESKDSLQIIFDIISDRSDLFIKIVKYYISNATPLNVNPKNIVSCLFRYMDPDSVYKLLNSYEYSQRNFWNYTFFSELPSELIGKKEVDELYSFLRDKSDSNIISSYNRDIEFLKKYSLVDGDVLIRGCKIILSKKDYSPFIVTMYFSNIFYNNIDNIIKQFKNHYSLLRQIYMFMLNYEQNIDYNGHFFVNLYKVDKLILDEYIDYIAKSESRYKLEAYSRFDKFWEWDDYLELFDHITNSLISKIDYPQYRMDIFLPNLHNNYNRKTGVDSRKYTWIKHYISKYCYDELKMRCLFLKIANFDDADKIEFIMYFIESNESFDAFKKIPIIHLFSSWSGSYIPVLKARKNYLKELLTHLKDLKDLKYLEHRNYIEKMIDDYNNEINNEKIKETLDV